MDAGLVNSASSSVGSMLGTSSQTQSQTTAGTEDVTKDEFLQLLVAQMKNQDPLNPVDSQNFLQQLATFSSLEQLVAIRSAVDQLAGITTDSSTDTTTLPSTSA